ncbi:MAG: right-handed parallel beta-helix repeat-containing protein [Nanoarchaeota archaeon]
MYPSKKRRLVVMLVIGLLLLLGVATFFFRGEITGAAIGLPSQGISVPEEVSSDPAFEDIAIPEVVNQSLPITSEESDFKIQANCGGVTACNCGDTVTSSYNLSSNLGPCNSPTPDGLYVGANNIVIDCKGYSIIGNNVGDSYGGYNNGYSNVTVQNCNILNFSSGIFLNSGTEKNITIFNNTIHNNTNDGIWASGSSVKSVNITGNTIYGSTIYGVLFLGPTGSLNVIERNIIYSAGNGLRARNAYIINNTLYNTTYPLTSDGNNTIVGNSIHDNSQGINLFGVAGNDNITGNLIYNNNGINLNGIDAPRNSNISHNIVYNNSGIGIRVLLNNSFFFNNTVYNNTKEGFYIEGSNNTFLNNTVFENNLSGYSLSGAKNNILSYNFIYDNLRESTLGEIYLTGSSENNNISGNIINKIRINRTGRSGVHLKNLNLSNKVENNIITNLERGIACDDTSNVNFVNNTLYNNTYAFYLGNTFYYNYKSNNNTFVNNNINNSEYGFYLYTNFNNNSFESNTIINSTNASIYISGSTNNTFTNIVINNSLANGTNATTNPSIFITTGIGNIYNYFTNLTLPDKNDLSSGASSYLYLQWYADVYVFNSSGGTLAGANVTAKDVISAVDGSVLTDSNGRARLTLTEYFMENDVRYYLTNNHTISAWKGNYTLNSTKLNLITTNSTSLNLSITEVSCGLNLSSGNTFYLGKNLTISGNCFTINVSNVSIYGEGYSLIGDNTSSGIMLNGARNTFIFNLNIINFTKGVELYNSNNSNFTRLTATNNTYGIFLNNSNNNKIYDSVVDNNTLANVYALGTTSNYLINISTNLSWINVTDSSSLFQQWYVKVNVTFNNSLPVPNANASGYFNDTGLLEHSKLTDGSGLARLELSELKKNASGTYYLTPNPITASLVSSNLNASNSTSINLTQTSNTQVNLWLNLNCTPPSAGMNITQNTLLCPGSYSLTGFGGIGVIQITNSSVNLTCEDTILTGDGQGTGLSAYYLRNLSIGGCTFKNYVYGLNLKSLNYSKFIDLNLENNAIWLSDSHYNNFSFNNFSGGSVNFYSGSANNSFFNNTFSNQVNAIVIHQNLSRNSFNYQDPSNNLVYHNIFQSSTSKHIYQPIGGNNFNTTINVSGTLYTQGNQYDDYCDKGSDTNGDGYADAASSNGNDYPYNATTSSKFSGSGADYGPKIIPCVTEVQLGSSSGGGRTTAAPAAAATVETPKPAGPTKAPVKEVPPETFTVAETKKFLKTESLSQRLDTETTQVKVTLQNTGTKRMLLFPELDQQTDDPYFIITRKTLGAENSLFSKISDISYSPDSIAGRLLKAEIVNPEQILLNPGETIEKTLEIKEGLVAPKQMKIQFTTFGETVNEQEVKIEKKSVSGTAVDVDTAQKTIDVYAVIVPEEVSKKIEGQATNPLTGAAIVDLKQTSSEYLLEFSLGKAGKSSIQFGDIYGPYLLKEGKVFVFAQQLKYNSKEYHGQEILRAKIYHGGEVIAENEFEIELG